LERETTESINFLREAMRLKSLSSYIVVRVLTAMASFLTAKPLDLKEATITLPIKIIHYLAVKVFSVSIRTCDDNCILE
jgi:hypothetical protein